nr:MAG TPA: hypothetical protein [Caudoviricetes sp.]
MSTHTLNPLNKASRQQSRCLLTSVQFGHLTKTIFAQRAQHQHIYAHYACTHKHIRCQTSFRGGGNRLSSMVLAGL